MFKSLLFWKISQDFKNMATKSKRRFGSPEKRSIDWMPHRKQFIHLMKTKGWKDPKE